MADTWTWGEIRKKNKEYIEAHKQATAEKQRLDPTLRDEEYNAIVKIVNVGVERVHAIKRELDDHVRRRIKLDKDEEERVAAAMAVPKETNSSNDGQGALLLRSQLLLL
jgi:hypothetical protein